MRRRQVIKYLKKELNSHIGESTFNLVSTALYNNCGDFINLGGKYSYVIETVKEDTIDKYPSQDYGIMILVFKMFNKPYDKIQNFSHVMTITILHCIDEYSEYNVVDIIDNVFRKNSKYNSTIILDKVYYNKEEKHKDVDNKIFNSKKSKKEYFSVKDSNNTEDSIKYDANGNIIHYKDSNGFEEWYDYNENNDVIHYKDSDGFKYWKDYDENNNIIHFKNSNGYEYWREYDENNNLIHYKASNGEEYW